MLDRNTDRRVRPLLDSEGSSIFTTIRDETIRVKEEIYDEIRSFTKTQEEFPLQDGEHDYDGTEVGRTGCNV